VINAENGTRLFAPQQTIEAGPWNLRLRRDELADITYRGHPVLRAIRPVIRDHDWRTLPSTVDAVAGRAGAGTFTLGLGIGFAGYGAEYCTELTVRISGDELTVAFDGVAPSDFRSNRIGLVVLHRPDDAGRDIPRGFVTEDGTPTPALQLLEKLAPLRGADVLDVEGSVPRLVLYPVKTDFGVLLFAANLTETPLRAAVKLEHGYTRTFDIPAWSVKTRPLG
jgi:hypothetical protein